MCERALGRLGPTDASVGQVSNVVGRLRKIDAEALWVPHACTPNIEHHAGKIIIAAEKVGEAEVERPDFFEGRAVALQNLGLLLPHLVHLPPQTYRPEQQSVLSDECGRNALPLFMGYCEEK